MWSGERARFRLRTFAVPHPTTVLTKDFSMVKRIPLALLCSLALCIAAASQSVVVTGKKTVYRRPQPISEFKKSFTVNYPKVKAATPALSKKIESTISYARILQIDVRDEIKESQWLEDADYKVDYNGRGVLVITLSIEGSGAYPDGSSKTVAVDLKTGDRITPAHAFTDLSGLTALVAKKQEQEIEIAIKELREDPEEKDTDPSELFSDKKFSAENLDEFAIDNSGVTFIYDYGFPHVIRALEPEGRYKFSWSEIAKFVKPTGPFGKFVAK